MSFLGKLGELLSPNDPELVEKTLTRLTEQDTWNDVFSTKLIELLDNIDGIKADIRSRQREVEAEIRKRQSDVEGQIRNQQNAADARVTQATAQLEQATHLFGDAQTLCDQAKSAFNDAQSAAVAAAASSQEAKALCEQARSRYEESQNAVVAWFDEAQKVKAATDGSLLRLRVLVSALCLLLALTWVGIVWLVWLLHPFAVALPAAVSIVIIAGSFALKRWLLHAS